MAIERVLAETLTFSLHALLSFYPKVEVSCCTCCDKEESSMFKIASSPRLVANIRVADTVLAARQLSVRSCVIAMCERNMHGLLASLNGRRAISCEVPIGSRAEFSRHRACPVVVQSYMAAFYL